MPSGVLVTAYGATTYIFLYSIQHLSDISISSPQLEQQKVYQLSTIVATKSVSTPQFNKKCLTVTTQL